MSKRLLEYWFPDGFPNDGNHGPIQVYFDPEANSGNGEVTFVDSSSDTLDPITNRGVSSYPEQYGSPPNPFYSSAGNKFTLSKISSTPYAQAASAAVVCDIALLNIDVQPATSGNNGQISIDASGTNGAKEYSIDDGATWSSSNVFSGLAPGTYPVVAADAARFCTVRQDVDVPNEIQVVNDLKITGIDKTDQQTLNGIEGEIIVNVAGTHSPFTYVLTFPSGGTKTQSSNTFINLPPGVYTVTVTDSEGFSRTQPNIILLEFGNDEPNEPLGPTRITEEITIDVRDVACKNPFPLMWLNVLGGWDFWLFENKQVFELEIDIDEEFASAYTDLSAIRGNRSYNRVESRRAVTIGANNVNQDEAQAIAKLMQSEKVCLMAMDDAGNWKCKVELTPVPGTITIQQYDSSLNYQAIELTLMYPEDYI